MNQNTPTISLSLAFDIHHTITTNLLLPTVHNSSNLDVDDRTRNRNRSYKPTSVQQHRCVFLRYILSSFNNNKIWTSEARGGLYPYKAWPNSHNISGRVLANTSISMLTWLINFGCGLTGLHAANSELLLLGKKGDAGEPFRNVLEVG